MTVGQNDEPVFEATPEGKRTLDRRTLIKGAAVAGAVAWTAPVIIDSMASPAAATTTCFNARLENISSAPPGDCAPGGVAGASSCVTTTSTTPNGTCSGVTFTNNGDGTWTVCVTRAGCYLTSVGSFNGGSCETPCTITGTTTTCCSGIPNAQISHIDVTYCCHS